jgi:hypothetical protein
MIFLCLTALIGAQENVNIEESEMNEVVKIFQEEDNQMNLPAPREPVRFFV